MFWEPETPCNPWECCNVQRTIRTTTHERDASSTLAPAKKSDVLAPDRRHLALEAGTWPKRGFQCPFKDRHGSG